VVSMSSLAQLVVTSVGEGIDGTFFAALDDLGPTDLRILHLAMARATALEAAGRGAEADTLLLGLLRIVQDESGHALGEVASLW
jgi:hypothetical protein